MIITISSAEQAREVLRIFGNLGQKPTLLVFDIKEDLHEEIPLVWRVCEHCDHEFEYLGKNVWGHNFQRGTCYCPHCGYSLKNKVCVDLAIQGDRVLETGYRYLTSRPVNGVDPL